jgi:hypothetical protein
MMDKTLFVIANGERPRREQRLVTIIQGYHYLEDVQNWVVIEDWPSTTHIAGR